MEGAGEGSKTPVADALRRSEVLLGGDHKKVAAWRQEMRETTTREQRPDLWDRHLANRQPKGAPGK